MFCASNLLNSFSCEWLLFFPSLLNVYALYCSVRRWCFFFLNIEQFPILPTKIFTNGTIKKKRAQSNQKSNLTFCWFCAHSRQFSIEGPSIRRFVGIEFILWTLAIDSCVKYNSVLHHEHGANEREKNAMQ